MNAKGLQRFLTTTDISISTEISSHLRQIHHAIAPM